MPKARQIPVPTQPACAGAVGQQGLLPKPTDSRLWLLEVRPGQERRLVVSLMAKACKQTLFIKSAFMQDHLAVRLLTQPHCCMHPCTAAHWRVSFAGHLILGAVRA